MRCTRSAVGGGQPIADDRLVYDRMANERTTRRHVAMLMNEAYAQVTAEPFFIVQEMSNAPATTTDRIIMKELVHRLGEWQKTRTVATVSMVVCWAASIVASSTLVMVSDFEIFVGLGLAGVSTLNLIYCMIRRAVSIRRLDMLIVRMNLAIRRIAIVDAA